MLCSYIEQVFDQIVGSQTLFDTGSLVHERIVIMQA